ncbi:MAG: tRNA (adenosine(37)-N6)-dimethylallyltransferase MiaA [Bdellovibrionales bacterium GWB1_55_8]|nr:MAG: tRNA (adenosine(37)-N6)-dimethylallyltransferase MiaA [Bdellovibrionales bacterium GWB1_55_8]
MKIPILTGTTASGKTAIAIELARDHGDIEIVNADSMLVYRGMDVGTAKPSAQELRDIPHHLVDIRNPDEPYTAGDFFREATAAIREIQARGKKPFVVGGTGFYLKALLYGMWSAPPADPGFRARLENLSNEQLFSDLSRSDPVSAAKIGQNDRYRLVRALEILHLSGQTTSELRSATKPIPNPDFEFFWVDRDTPELHSRIHERTAQMLRNGLIDEVSKILKSTPEARSLGAVGYAQVRDFLKGNKPKGRKIKEGMAGVQDEIELATRQLVKRQRTWFKSQTDATPTLLERDRDLLLGRLREAFSVANGQGKK